MVPHFPHDATILSIVSAVRRLASADTHSELMRPIIRHLAQLRAQYSSVEQISSRLLGGLVSPQTLAAAHSSVAFHGKFISRQDELAWHQSAGQGHALAIRNMREQTNFDESRKRGLRYCEECAEDDIRAYGCAHWHVCHQLCGVYHCPRHQEPLMSLCARCGAPLSTSHLLLRLPRDPCRACGAIGGRAQDHEVPAVYWTYLDLCRRALEDKAPELRPRARHAIVSKLNSYWLETGTTQTMRDRLFESWHVSSLDDFRGQMGSNIGAHAFEHLLANGVAVAPNQITAAVVSCAIANLPSSLLAEALKGTAEEVVVELSRQSGLEQTLLSHAERTGYPIELARGLAAGIAQTGATRRGRASAAAQTRFLAGLSKADRDLVTAARVAAKAKKAGLPTIGSAEYGQHAREVALEVLKTGDARRRSIPQHLYKWLKTHDGNWLNAHFPRKADLSESFKAMHRTAAQRLRLQGAQTRGELQKASSACYQWLRRNDAEWLDREFPALLLFDFEKQREKRRSAALAMPIAGTSRTRADVRRRHTVYQWLLENDKDWLDSTFPCVPTSGTKRP